jgi:hypothetical protein
MHGKGTSSVKGTNFLLSYTELLMLAEKNTQTNTTAGKGKQKIDQGVGMTKITRKSFRGEGGMNWGISG